MSVFNTPINLLCPGQGAQFPGMGQAWFDWHPVARQTFAAADDALGMDLSKICFTGDEQQIHRTDIAQVAIYVTSVACYQALVETQRIGPLAAVAGLSLGEFTALHLAGAYDFITGLKLVRLRGQAMQEAAEAAPGGSGMVALVGADESQANEICSQARRVAVTGPAGVSDGADAEVLVAANMNCPGQVVISGHLSACERALDVAGEMGVKGTLLKVAGAFHSPLMQPAADRLAQALDKAHWNQPVVPVLSNVTASPHDATDVRSIKQRLIDQLTHPVRWSDSMTWLIGHSEGPFVELAPGKVLTGLMRRIDRRVKVHAFAEPDT